MNRRRAILAVLAAALGLAVAVAACGDPGGGGSGSATHAGPTGTVSNGSGGGAGGHPHPPALRHPPVPARLRTYPRLKPHVGGRNTAFTLSFRARRNLGSHGHTTSYYGVIVAPIAPHPRHGCYGFGRYVRKGSKGQLAQVGLHPRGRRWCRGSYQASVYLTGKPYCPPRSGPLRPCSTASYPAIPTGWAYFSVR